MRGPGRYGRDHGPRGYDAGWRGDGRGGRRPDDRGHRRYDGGSRPYDAGYGRYDRGYRAYDGPFPRRGGHGPGPGYSPYDATGWAPFAFTPFAFDPALGWAGWGPGTAYVPPGPPPEPRRVPPRRSPAYGRGGDRELREWAARYGYDVEHTIQPRRGPRRP